MKYWLTAIVLVLSSLDYNPGYAQTKNLMPAYQAISTPDFGYLPTYVARSRGVDSPAARQRGPDRGERSNHRNLIFRQVLDYRIGKMMTHAKAQSSPSSDYSPFCKGGISQSEKSPLAPPFD